MRVVDVNEFYAPAGGGVRTYLDRKMALMAELGHELIVVAPGRETWVEERPGGGRVHWLASPPLPFDTNYGLFCDRAALHAALDAYDPDVVECSSPWRAAWIVGEWRGRALKSFFMHNDNLATYPGRWFERFASEAAITAAFAWYTRYTARFLTHYDCVLTNGPALAERLAARGLRIDAAMPLGIERAHFSPALRDEELRAALLRQCGLSPDALLLLGLGRHHPEKRWPMVVDAVERAGASAPVGLVLIGGGVDTERIEARVAGSPHIRLFRPVYDRARLSRITASCDALIHGAETEPFGLVASEAMASGLPLVVPDTGGCVEVANPLSSEIYAARDAASCAAAILRLARRDRALLRRAAVVAAASVRTDREHAVDLLGYYRAAVEEKTDTRVRPSGRTAIRA